MIEMVWAQSRNNIIGDENKLIWDFKKDMKHFKETTQQKDAIVVMGYKTFLSLNRPNGLPGRRNIVLSRNNEVESNEVEVIRNIDEILNIAKNNHVFIIGGASIYEQFLSFADKLTVTIIDKEYEGDTSIFPITSKFSLTEKISVEENRIPLHFLTFERVAHKDGL